MKDKNGKDVKVGDTVAIEALVVELREDGLMIVQTLQRQQTAKDRVAPMLELAIAPDMTEKS